MLGEKLSFLKDDLVKFKKRTLEILSSGESFFNNAGKHLFNSGGKHIRPILLLLSSKLSEYEGDKHIELSSIFELIHSATLLHDDVIDNADTRRGVETVNAKFGQDIAILEGDFLYSKSIYLLVKNYSKEIMELVAEATQTMIHGESMQVAKRWFLELDEDDYFKIIYNKTSFLISACCQAGGLLAEKNHDFILKLKQYGDNFGIAFQLVDDTFDFLDQPKTIGKPIGVDIRSGLVTLPLLYTMKNCNDDERIKIKAIFQKKLIFDEDAKFINTLVKKYHGVELTIEKAEDFAKKALEALYTLPKCESRNALEAITEFLYNREF